MPAAGVFRAALLQDGMLRACVFLGPDHVLPERDWLAAVFAEARVTLPTRRALLAGQPSGGAVADPAICVCHGIGAETIRRAAAEGCRSVDAIGRATRAGTNCGSCRPEIAALLAAAPALA